MKKLLGYFGWAVLFSLLFYLATSCGVRHKDKPPAQGAFAEMHKVCETPEGAKVYWYNNGGTFVYVVCNKNGIASIAIR